MRGKWYVGLMTGTVLDGQIDVAFLKTDGEKLQEFGAYALVPYDQKTCQILEETLTIARGWNFIGPDPAFFAKAEKALTLAQAEAVRTLANATNLDLTDIEAVGFHGQTVLHHPPSGNTLGQTRQLGDGQLMAAHLGVPVIYDFRRDDMAMGGQGAPLCACYHGALLDQIGAGPDTAILNLGGVANLSWRDASGLYIAFDTGPANAPLNDWVKSCGLGAMDRDGALAAAGRVDEAKLTAMLSHGYFAKPFPKSLDRFDFSAAMAEGASPADGAALLTAFCAAAVAKGLALLPSYPKRLIVAGGGRHNPTLLAEIEARAKITLENADSYGWRGDAVEAECFAYLAARHRAKLPITFPTTTGCPRPMTGGKCALP